MEAWIVVFLFGLGMGAYGFVRAALDRHLEPPLPPSDHARKGGQSFKVVEGLGLLPVREPEAVVVSLERYEHLLRRVRELEETVAQRGTAPTPSR